MMQVSPFTVARRPSLADSLVALDTNTLLLPYTASSHSIDAIEEVYAVLKGGNRLVIPSQVAIEYERNRPKKLGELFQALQTLMSQQPPAKRAYPLLDGVKEWKDALSAIEQATSALKEMRAHLSKVRDTIRGWDRTDPVHDVYARVFASMAFSDSGLTAEDLKKERERRFAQKLPPGYKDAAKDDGGSGDVEIWFALIAVAKNAKRDLVFVTSEEKADWFQQSANEALYPRPELLREFRNETGQEVDLLRLSDLLVAMHAPQAAVDDIRRQEQEAVSIDFQPAGSQRRASSRMLDGRLYFDLQAVEDCYVFSVPLTPATTLRDAVQAVIPALKVVTSADYGNRWFFEDPRTNDLIATSSEAMSRALHSLGVVPGTVLRPRFRAESGELVPLIPPKR